MLNIEKIEWYSRVPKDPIERLHYISQVFTDSCLTLDSFEAMCGPMYCTDGCKCDKCVGELRHHDFTMQDIVDIMLGKYDA